MTDLLGSYLNQAASPPQTSPVVNGEDLLSGYLPPTTPGSYPLGDPRNQGRLPDSYKTPIVAPKTPPVGDTVDPYDPITKQLSDAAHITAGYIGNQLYGVPGQIANEFQAGKDLAASGASDIKAGNYAPTFPSTNPQSWGAGGVLKTAAGALGALGSPISGVADKLVQEPVTEATGNPQAGQVAGMAASAYAANAIPHLLSGAPADAETLRLANIANQSNIPIRASQISTNPFINKMDQVLGWIPGSGRQAEDAAQKAAYIRAASNTFGEDTPQITRSVIQDAKDRIGGVMNTVEARTPIQFDQQLGDGLTNVLQNAKTLFGEGTDRFNVVKNQVSQIVSLAREHNGTIPGDAWATLYHKGSPLERLSGAADSDVGNLANDLKGVAQDAVQRQATPEDAAAYTNARFQYKNMKTVEPLVTTGMPGEISPAGLNQRVRANFPTTNAGPLGDLADIGQRFLRQPRDSGTPLGEKVLGMVTSPGVAVGSALAGQQLGLSLPEIAGLGVAAPAINATVARMGSALLNNPVYRNSLLRGPGDTSSLAKELIYGAVPNMPTNPPRNP